MGRYAKGGVSWSDKDIKTLIRMRAAGKPIKIIAKAVNRSPSAVSNFVARYGDRFGISVSRQKFHGGKGVKNFNDIYNGSVPYLHWTITKPWKVDNKK